MLDLNELNQLAEFADLGTLSKVAEREHISTPSLTRSMKHLEEGFGVPLFDRSKNRIALNENGKLAASLARRVLAEAGQAVLPEALLPDYHRLSQAERERAERLAAETAAKA